MSALYDAFDAGHELSNEYIMRTIGGSMPLSYTMREELTACATGPEAGEACLGPTVTSDK